MNIRKIVTYNALRKQFTPEELIFADTLYNASESERELLITALQPEKVVTKRAGKKSASRGASKSSRASGMAAALTKSLEQQRQVAKDGDADDNDPSARCQKEFAGGFICDEPADANVHHLRGATGYHEFDAGKSSASPTPRAGAKSSTNGGATNSTANPEDETVSAGAVAGGSGE